MKRSKILTFADPFQYSANVRSADIEIFPTSKGTFEAQLTQVTFDRLWMQRFEETLPRVHKGTIRPDHRVFTFLTEDQPDVYNRGQLFSSGDLCANDSDIQHVVTTGKYRLGGVSLKPDEVATACKSMMGFEFQPEHCTRILRPAPDLMKRLLDLHAMVGALAKATPELLEFPEVVRAVEHKLTHALLTCLTDCNASKMKMAQRGHIVARFESFIEEHSNTPLYLDEVCAAVGVAERTLRAVCKDHLGMGPIRYLNLRRMHLVRHALRRATPGSATVTQIAMKHGFWELGAFQSPIASYLASRRLLLYAVRQTTNRRKQIDPHSYRRLLIKFEATLVKKLHVVCRPRSLLWSENDLLLMRNPVEARDLAATGKRPRNPASG